MVQRWMCVSMCIYTHVWERCGGDGGEEREQDWERLGEILAWMNWRLESVLGRREWDGVKESPSWCKMLGKKHCSQVTLWTCGTERMVVPLEKGDLWVALNYCNYFQSSQTRGNDWDSAHLYEIWLLMSGELQKKQEAKCITNFTTRLFY